MKDLLPELRARSQEALRLAKRADRLHKSATRKLKSFSLWTRVVKWSRFSSLRDRRKRYEMDRFNYGSVMIHLARSIKFYERRKKQRW